jgi:hypothetical protein
MYLMVVLGCCSNDALDGVQRGLNFSHIGMVHANFRNMSFVDNTFNDVYPIDAPWHAPDMVNISKCSLLHCLCRTYQF